MTVLNGYIAAALMLVLAAVGASGYYYGSKHAGANAEIAMAEHLAADKKAEAEQQDRVRKLEQSLAVAQTKVSNAYERGKKDAKATGAAIAADLRAGNLRLQRRWEGCEARLSDPSSASGEPDAASRDRSDSAGRIVSAAAQCDAQVKGLQDLLTAEREKLKELEKPKKVKKFSRPDFWENNYDGD